MRKVFKVFQGESFDDSVLLNVSPNSVPLKHGRRHQIKYHNLSGKLIFQVANKISQKLYLS